MDYKKQSGKPDAGFNRLFRIVPPESMYMIWKIQCERAISWANDPARAHSDHEIHNKWLQAINLQLGMDSVQTSIKAFKKKVIEPKIVLETAQKITCTKRGTGAGGRGF